MANDTPNTPDTPPAFDALYRSQARQVILDIAANELASGAAAEERAEHYAAHGKPDFVLAYLLDSTIPDERKRELYASAHEQHAIATELRAREFDRKFHRPFPLLATDATNDRVTARRIRAGMPPSKGRGRQIPLM